MFRLVVVAITVLILMSAMRSPAAPAAADACGYPIMPGDWTDNGSVEIGDAQNLARSLLHLIALAPCGGDVDCSGDYTIGDAVKIARYLVGLPYTQHEPCPDIGQPIVPFAGITVEVRTDKASYAEGELVGVTVTVTNTTQDAIDLRYRDCQRFDVRIVDSELQDVWRWSHDKGFCAEPASIPLAAGERRTFETTWDQRDNSGNPVPRGSYAVFGISSHCRVFPNDCGVSSAPVMISLT